MKNEITWSKKELEKIRVGDLQPTVMIDVGDKLLIRTALQDILGVVRSVNEETSKISLGGNTYWYENEIIRTLHHDASTFVIENVFLVVSDETEEEETDSGRESQTHSKGSIEEKSSR